MPHGLQRAYKDLPQALFLLHFIFQCVSALVSLYAHAQTYAYTLSLCGCADQRPSCDSLFSPSTMWIPSFEQMPLPTMPSHWHSRKL